MFVRLSKKPPLLKGRGTTEGGGGIQKRDLVQKTRGRFYCLGIEFTRIKSIQFKRIVCLIFIFT